MTFGFLSGSRNFCKLLWVSCEVLFLHGYAWCVGHAIVQGDEGPVGEVAQGDKVHGLPVRHGEKQEEEEGEVEQEVEGNKEEEKSNNNAHVHG